MLTFYHSAIFNSSDDPNSAVSQPVLQCVQVKPLAGQQGTSERFRVVFSDINNFVQSMLATRQYFLSLETLAMRGCWYCTIKYADFSKKRIMSYMRANSEKGASFG